MSDDIERCEVEFCGFEWDSVGPLEIGQRIIKSSAMMGDLIADGAYSEIRTLSDMWSPLEYAGHVRDVLLNLRDRIVVGINEDSPICKGLYGTPRIDLGLYKGDAPDVVALELKMAASLFSRTWDRIPDNLRSKTMEFGWPRMADRSLTWIAAQALHEVEHHLADVRSGSVSGNKF